MQPRILPATLLLATALAGSVSTGHGQQAPARPAALPGAPTRVAGRLTGTVTDGANGKPVSYASVAVLNAAGTPVNGGVCGDDGRFVLPGIPPGTYTIKVSFLGYQDITRTGVVVPAAGGAVALGTLPMAASAQKLGEVVVVARKPLIEEKVDRTIYNADVDKTTAGGDATDVLKRVPLLSVDLDGNVSLRGSQNIKVLINSKPSTIAASSVADALKQIPAEQIQTVEVITSPSAKYDAEGSGGIINIITKQNNLRGASLNVNSSAGTRASNLGLSGSVSNGKFGASLGGFGRAQYNTPGSFENVQTSSNLQSGQRTTVQQNAATRQTNAFGRYTLGLTYDFDKQNSLAGSLAYGVRNGKNYQDQLTSQTLAGATTGITSVRDVTSTSNSGTVDASLNYTHLYDVKQRELSVLTLFSRNNQTNDFTNSVFAPTDRAYLGELGNNNQSHNQEITGQIDYQTPTAKDQLLEVGVKNIVRRVTSDYSYFYGPGLAPPTPPAPNSFLYKQNVAATYVAYTMALPKGFALKPGVRAEYTTIDASFSDPNGVLTATAIPNYLKVLPSVNLSRKFSNGNVLKLAYNIRIQRPSLQFLNPNVQASNPLNASAGNPILRPENTQNYELGYSTQIKQKVNLNISTFVRSTNNAIQTVRVPLADSLNPTRAVGALLSTFRNAGTERAYGTNLFVGINNAKVSLNGSMDLFYSVLRNNDANAIYNSSNQGFVINGRVFGAYNLNKSWSLQAFAFVRGQQVQLQGYQSGFGIYSLSLQRNFAEKRGSIGFGAENFFSNRITIRNSVSTPYVDQYNGVSINAPVLTQNSANVLNRLSIKVNFSYRIGKLTAGPTRSGRGVSNDDLKEGGDGGGVGGDAGGQGGAPAGGGGRPGGQGAPGGGRPGGYPGAGQRPAGAPAPASATDSTRRAIPADSLQQLRNQPAPPNGATGQPAAAPGVAVPAAPGVAVPATPANGPTAAPTAQPAAKPSPAAAPVGAPSPGTTSPGGITPAGSPGGRP